MAESVCSFSVRVLLTDGNQYCVPMYQRNYAWGEGEINQLIQDVLDIQQKHKDSAQQPPYYIGTLVVYQRSNGSFEVIDGQQRFTTLTLMAMCLKRLQDSGKLSLDMGWYEQPNLDFESRVKSSRTFDRISQGVDINKLYSEEYNLDVINGFVLLEKGLLGLGSKLTDYCDYLFNHVQITRVPVPKDTDLNHYFEVMNSRGEQLEKHEVVKARLMSVLNDIDDKALRAANIQVLSRVWDAAANMERYVQYGFTPDERHEVFGKDWGLFMPQNFEELVGYLVGAENSDTDTSGKASLTLQEILDTSPDSGPSASSEMPPERFNSVINFSNFLLHVLRIWSGEDVPLDDKQLLDQFENYFLKFKVENKIEKVQGFVYALLKVKYLFDQFIIKREFTEIGGKWSLKRLHYYNKKSQSYINTFDQDSEDGFEGINRQILMLLSALHVSTPTLVYKHWLNGALYALYTMTDVKAGEYLAKLEHLARQFVYGRFLNANEPADYYQMIYQQSSFLPVNAENPEVVERLKFSNIENNLVFNYLDYLIWRDATDQGVADQVIRQFEFAFRSSVEHFYPRHPMAGHSEMNSQSLHRFGNLCLISHSKNSRLSNFQPKGKRDHFQAAIKDKSVDTLKVYKMIQLMDDSGGWGEGQIEQHEEEMLALFEKDSQRGVRDE